MIEDDPTPGVRIGEVRNEITAVENNRATVNFYRNEVLKLTRTFDIPSEAAGDTTHPTFQKILDNYNRFVKYNVIRVGVKNETVEKGTI